MEFVDYVKEIELLKEKYGLKALEVATLNLAAAFEVGDMSYEQLKKELTKDDTEE